MDYVNKPIGEGRRPEQPLKPLVAVPTTTGHRLGEHRRSACSTCCRMKVKTGISHCAAAPHPGRDRPAAHADPARRRSPPRPGMDILCHALESYTARSYTTFDRKQPEQRVPYCGSNPISDMWSREGDDAARAVVPHRPCTHGDDVRGARATWRWPRRSPAWASATPGVHIPHANAYPIAGRVKDFRPDGLPRRTSRWCRTACRSSLTAPEAFRFTFDAAPERHLRGRRAARARTRTSRTTRREQLPSRADRPDARHRASPTASARSATTRPTSPTWSTGTMKQQRLLATAPREVDRGRHRGHPDAARSSCGDRAAGHDRWPLRRGQGSPTSTTRRWPGRSTPPTPRSTGVAAAGRGPAAARRRASLATLAVAPGAPASR